MEDLALLLKSPDGEEFSSGVKKSFTSSLPSERSKGTIVSPVSKPTASLKCWGEERKGEGKSQVMKTACSGHRCFSSNTQESKTSEGIIFNQTAYPLLSFESWDRASISNHRQHIFIPGDKKSTSVVSISSKNGPVARLGCVVVKLTLKSLW